MLVIELENAGRVEFEHAGQAIDAEYKGVDSQGRMLVLMAVPNGARVQVSRRYWQDSVQFRVKRGDGDRIRLAINTAPSITVARV